jgi:hypothetical protein
MWEEQHGVVTRRQALAAGLTDAMVEARVASGRWQRLHHGVYATFGGELPRRAVLWAALLRAGPGAVLSHQTAAELAGLAPQPVPVVHVSVPRSRRVRRVPGVVIHGSARIGAAAHPTRRPPQTRIEETVLDLIATSPSAEEAIGWLVRAVGLRLTTAPRLRSALDARARMRHRLLVADALADIAEGCHSVLELRYLRRVERAHGLPPGTRQTPRGRRGGRYYDDVRYPFDTLVELDGRLVHQAPFRDLRRDNAAAVAGLVVLRYGWSDVAGQPCAVAAQVASVLARQGWLGTARACGPDCMIGETFPGSSLEKSPPC